MLYIYHFDKKELKITEMTKILRVHMVLGGPHLKIRDVCMDLEPCFKVHNLVVIQLKNATPNLVE